MKLRFYLFSLVLFFAIKNTPAQNFPTAAVTPLTNTSFSQVSADFNRDSHLDIAYLDAASSGNVRLLLGKGDGTFITGQVIPLASAIGGNITVGDVNADGILDLAIGYGGGGTSPLAITVFIGKGDGTFGAAIASPALSYVSPPGIILKFGIADFDGDRLPDLIYSDGYEFLYFMKGDGRGNFGAAIRFAAFDPLKYIGYGMGNLSVYDLNGDGHPDLVGPGGNGLNVLLGQGGGTFAPPVTYTTTGGLNLADFDGDGHIDAITCDGTTGKVSVYYGRSDGTFAPGVIVGGVPNHLGFVTGIADLHGDRKNRIVVASPDGVSITLGVTPGVTETYAGSFAQNIVAYSATNQYILGDFNEDGYTDIEMPADKAIAILYGKSDGTFEGGVSIATGGYIGVGGVKMVDVTGDHIPDAVLTTSAIFHGNGDGTFTQLPNYDTFFVQPTLFPADFNGDGNVDFLTNQTIFYSNGNGTFTSQMLSGLRMGTAPFSNGFFATGDFNHDGKPDVAASMTSNSIFVNGFAFAVSAPAANTYTYSYFNLTEAPAALGAGDFNGDRCDDVAASTQTQIIILKSDCLGNFTQVGSYTTGYTGISYISPFAPSLNATDMVVSDLDGDGYLDIVYPISSPSIVGVLYGRGDGTFTRVPDIPLAHQSSFVTAGDLDNDGHPDLVFSGHGLVTILHGQANRTFSAPQYLAAGYQSGKVALADLRIRGRLDIAVPNLGVEGNLTNLQGYSFAVFLNPLPALITGFPTVASLTCSPATISLNNTALVTATITSSNGTPTGSVVFTDNGSPLATQNLNSGTTSLTYTGSAAGNHAIMATYTPVPGFAASSASCMEIVNALPTNSVLTVNPTASTYGSPVTLTAVVTPVTPPGPSTPAGTVTFYNGTTSIGTASLANGVASLNLSSLSGANYNLTCVYGGSSIYATSNCNTVPLVINPAATTLTLSSSNNPAPALSTITFTARLAVNGQPVGAGNTINLGINGRTVALVTDSAGSATYTISGLPPNSYPVVANFTATANYLGSSANLTEVITAIPTTTTLTGSPNPVYQNQPLALAATIRATVGSATPDGSVTVFDGSIALTTITLPSVTFTGATSTANFSTSALAPGSHILTAVYTPVNSPSGSFIASTSVPLTISVLPQTYTVSLADPSLTIQAEHHKTTTATITSIGGFNGPISIACGTLPEYVTCTWSETVLSLPANGTVSTRLTIDTDAVLYFKAADQTSPGPWKSSTQILLSTLVPFLLFRRTRRLATLLPLMFLALISLSISGCSGKYPGHASPGTYSIDINTIGTTAGSTSPTSQTTRLTLIVTP